MGHTLWVTPYDPDERWPCGEFVVQSEQDSGLPVWTAQNRSIEDTDVVLWYVFGIHHVTRPEDWPVMPVDTVSFWLKPFGFFDRNPALDVAPGQRGLPPGTAPDLKEALDGHYATGARAAQLRQRRVQGGRRRARRSTSSTRPPARPTPPRHCQARRTSTTRCAPPAQAFEDGWRDTTPSERMACLLKMADAIESNAERLVEIEAENTGKPKGLTMSEEIPPMADQIRFFAGAARSLEGRRGRVHARASPRRSGASRSASSARWRHGTTR